MGRKIVRDTPRRVRFFDAYDHRKKDVSLRQFCKEPTISVPQSTASYWLQQRKQLGSPAIRRTRKLSTNRLGRSQSLTDTFLRFLINPAHLSHNLRYPAIVEAEHLAISAHTLQRSLVTRTGAKRFKKPRTKGISARNKTIRIRYGAKYEDCTVDDHWQWVYYTDESHFNSQDLATKQQYDLHSPGSY